MVWAVRGEVDASEGVGVSVCGATGGIGLEGRGGNVQSGLGKVVSPLSK